MTHTETIFQCKYDTMPHIQSFKGGIKHRTILSLAVPWPQIFFDEKKIQAEATVELAPRF